MSSAKTFSCSLSCCIMQKAALCAWPCEFFYGYLFCELLQACCGWGHCSLSLGSLIPLAAQICCTAAVTAPPGDWGTQFGLHFPVWAQGASAVLLALLVTNTSLNFSTVVQSVGKSEQSDFSAHFCSSWVGGRPTILMRQKTHQASWELSGVRQLWAKFP